MIILGIESSCDETSIAILRDGKDILTNKISSQIEIHKEYGGVVPEIASRQHIKNIAAILDEALEEAKITLDDVDYIAVTYAPGLIGALLVGVSFAKGLSYAHNIPIIPVHHIKGHMYANFLEHDIELPCIALVVSGGHTNIVYMDENHKFINMGGTLDDAVGESCDKVARVLGLGYPGGPIVDKMYYQGDRNFLHITEPKVGEYDFSFSGIKTAVINFVNKMNMKNEEFKKEDLAASFLGKVVDILCKKTLKAAKDKNVKTIILAGGVAANSLLRSQLTEQGAKLGIKVYALPDGDVAGSILTCIVDSDVDMLYGIGGAPEGVISAAVIRALGGDMQARLKLRSEVKGVTLENDKISNFEKSRCESMGLTVGQVLTMNDLVKDDEVIFSATGITGGDLLEGIKRKGSIARTQTLVVRGKSKTVRYINSVHNLDFKDDKITHLVK